MSGTAPPRDRDIPELQDRLLAWFASNRRDFPWRRTSDPYAVLVAEKLLQQTAARKVVVDAYQTLVGTYPSAEALAGARSEHLGSVIAPLGFHYRAKELKALGVALLDRHAGKVPAQLQELKALPGVGDYAARAVLSFAYGQDVPVVDTNVARFLYRVFAISGRLPSNPARKKSLIDLAARLVPTGRSREFNLAVLDLCALICTPSRPKCTSCPVQQFCSFGQGASGL